MAKKQSAIDKLLGRNKPEAGLHQYAPDEVNEHGEYIKIGGSPVPGITLRQIVKGGTSFHRQVAWSPDGQLLASTTYDVLVIWDVRSWEKIIVDFGNFGEKNIYGKGLSWAPNGEDLAIGCSDGSIRIWNIKSKTLSRTLDYPSNKHGLVNSVGWSSNGQYLASIDTAGLINIWLAKTWQLYQGIQAHSSAGNALTWSSDSQTLATGSYDETIKVIDVKTGEINHTLVGHSASIYGLAWLFNNQQLISGSMDSTIRVWDIPSNKQRAQIEGHTAGIVGISLSSDNKILATKSKDGTVALWKNGKNSWELITRLSEKSADRDPIALVFHPKKLILASIADASETINIWEINYDILIGQADVGESIHYTAAKLVLVGDSGVGKTGLGWRLAHNEFKVQPSTHGQQFWVVPELGKKRNDGTECEAVLWDVAGQHIYRSIHSIFLDNVDASLILFDASNREDTLKGVEFWLNQLAGKAELPPSVLVGAKVDVSPPVLTQAELDQFCKRYGISGGYIGTSAKSGEGLERLLETLKAQIPWEQMTTTVTTVTFKKIKDYVLSLKEKSDRKGVLVRPEELRKQLQATDKNWPFTDAEMMTAVGHLANHGYVTILHSSAGEDYILLVPELFASVAASIFLHADKHPRELGAINENELLQGKYPIEEFKGLEQEEQQVLLDATVVRFLEHSLCFRESLGTENLLIFPSLIKQKRPLKDDVPSTDDISYIVHGRVENIYASLVVLLGYTSSFTRINQWANQAQYETDNGNICGFRLIEDREGEIELILYYGNDMPDGEREDFKGLFEQFLYQRDVEITPFPPVLCPKGHRQERATVIKRLREGKKFLYCEECGEKTNLPSTEPRTIGISASSWLQKEEASAKLRSVYETYLLRIKAYRRSWASPRCYISCVPEHVGFADRLKHDLNEAGVFVVEEASTVQTDDAVIVLDCPAYQKSWKNTTLGDDVALVKSRLSSEKLISITIEGNPIDVHDLKSCRPGDFCDETHYPISLFNLVLNLYAVPLTHSGLAPLRVSLHQQWGQSLAQFSSKLEIGGKMSTPLKVFISYSHKDEEFKDDLVTMLAGLQRRGIIDAWQDRRIEEGDGWYQEIQKAMNDCELAILLVSANFIASRFIQDEELPRFLRRRMEEGLRVVPVIVKPCMWQSEPVLKDLQGLPRDGKPVITFSKENGDRDQAWTDIAKAIEKRAK